MRINLKQKMNLNFSSEWHSRVLNSPLYSTLPRFISFWWRWWSWACLFIRLLFKSSINCCNFSKVISLPYSTSNIAIDILLLVCFFLIDLGRIDIAQSGNKTGSWFLKLNVFHIKLKAIRGPIGVSVALTIAAVFCSIYIYMFQTWVLNIEWTMMCTLKNLK